MTPLPTGVMGSSVHTPAVAFLPHLEGMIDPAEFLESMDRFAGLCEIEQGNSRQRQWEIGTETDIEVDKA